eukprot:m.242056 g.242056  ORF g.242056 m.242056 type:complete len:496 (-) comp13958_c0_seq1:158-1645(-)
MRLSPRRLLSGMLAILGVCALAFVLHMLGHSPLPASTQLVSLPDQPEATATPSRAAISSAVVRHATPAPERASWKAPASVGRAQSTPRLTTPSGTPVAGVARTTQSVAAAAAANTAANAAANAIARTEAPGVDAPDAEEIGEMVRFLERSNEEQAIVNEDKFPVDVTHPDFRPIIIMIHNRADYLRVLLATLRAVQGVERVLLVISQDVLTNPAVDAVIAEIDFCAYVRLYSPYSLELHPAQFPGDDPNDCPRDMPRASAIAAGCNSAEFPDKYGHYRESKFCAIKHHWWWKSIFVFERLRVLQTYPGYMLFLEEDHAVAPDALHFLRLALSSINTTCPDCMVTLGSYLDRGDGRLLQVLGWNSVKHNMGMAFNRQYWNRVRACKDTFCTFDDYNWDWTLARLSTTKCIESRAAVAGFGRVHHLGKCGVHKHALKCDTDAALKEFNMLMKRNEAQLFPAQLNVAPSLMRAPNVVKGSGGWGDPRDHQLCLAMADA